MLFTLGWHAPCCIHRWEIGERCLISPSSLWRWMSSAMLRSWMDLQHHFSWQISEIWQRSWRRVTRFLWSITQSRNLKGAAIHSMSSGLKASVCSHAATLWLLCHLQSHPLSYMCSLLTTLISGCHISTWWWPTCSCLPSMVAFFLFYLFVVRSNTWAHCYNQGRILRLPSFQGVWRKIDCCWPSPCRATTTIR